MKRLLLIVLLVSAICSSLLAETYYVRAGGSWANNGTSWATAWNHPNRTNYTPFTYGDTVFIAPGEYDSVRVLPPRGGTSIRTVYACSSEVTGLTYETRLTSILHSGNVVSGNWGDFATGVDSIYLNPTTLEWVTTDNNLVLYQRISGTKDSLMICVNSTGAVNADGEYYYDRPNDKLYVQPYGGGAASSYTFRYATKPIYQSSYEDQDNILLYGLDFRGGYQTVIMLNDGTAGAGDSVEIRNCNIGFSMVYSASNPSAIGCAAVYANNYSSWQRYLKVVGCTLHSVANTQEGAGGLHAGWGMLLYTVRNALIDSCVFINLPSSIGLKMGSFEHYGINADSIHIRNSFLYGGSGTNLWVGNYVEGVEVTGCVIGNNNATQPLKNLAFFTSSSSSAQDFMGGAVITNNTFVGGTEAIVQLRPHNSNGGNIFKYNIIYDPTGETNVGDIDISDDDYGTESPSSETYWDIDSNQYWFGANTFDFRAQQAASALNGQTSWAQWQAGGFDINSVNNVDPGLTVTTGVTTNAVAMTSQTYAGKTWTVYGAIQPSIDSCILITSLPDTLTVDTCYCLQDRKMTTTGTAIYANSRNIRIRNRYATRDTLEFGTDGGDGYNGIRATADNFTVDGLYIQHSPADPIDSAKNNICIYIQNVDTAKIWRTHVRPSGMNGRGLQNNSGGFDIDIWRLTHDSSGVNSYESRCNHLANIIYLIPEADHDDGNYFAKVHACSVYNAPHNILAISGGSSSPSLFYVDSNVFTVDARNLMYDITDGEGDACKSSGDAAGIDILGSGAGSRISYNKIRSGSNYEGGVGMLLQAMFGQLGDSVLIVGNDVDVSNGPSSRFRAGRTFGMYFRYVPGSGNSGSQYVAVRDNIWKTTVDTDTATEHIGREAETWSLILSGCGTGANESDSFKHIDFSRNTVQTVISGTPSGWYENSAIAWGNCDSTIADYANNGHIAFINNHYISPRLVIELANMQGIPGSNWLSIQDTIDAAFDTDSTITFDRTGSYTGHSTNNRIRDAIWLNNADDASIGWDVGGATSNDTLGMSIRYERTLSALVVNNNDDPVAAADVWVWNDYGDTVLTGITNGSGLFSGVVLYKFESTDKFPADSYALSDSTAFSPFIIKAKKDNDSAQVELTITSILASDTLQLVAGTPAEASPVKILRGINLKGVTIK